MIVSHQPSIEVCLSPALLHLYNTENKVVVIIDIFRATSTIVTAIFNGAASVIPVATVSECLKIGNEIEGSITAGERDGNKVPELQYGNSPITYNQEFIKGKTLVLTTTNGTRLLHKVENSLQILIGSFLNLTVLCDYLSEQNKDVLLGCASWKDLFNLEDTLFAGAVIDKLANKFNINCDSARAARYLYKSSGGTYILDFLKDSSHYHRLSQRGLQADMVYCTTLDKHPIVPVYVGNKIVQLG